jgi:hypothetical protein
MPISKGKVKSWIVFKDPTGKYVAVEDTRDGLYGRMYNQGHNIAGCVAFKTPGEAIEWIRSVRGD